jgi:hypothetical protein
MLKQMLQVIYMIKVYTFKVINLSFVIDSYIENIGELGQPCQVNPQFQPHTTLLSRVASFVQNEVEFESSKSILQQLPPTVLQQVLKDREDYDRKETQVMT